MLTVTLAPLTAEAFAPYGDVFEPMVTQTRRDGVATLENTREAARANLFLARASQVALPHRFDAMEQHPFSSQSFMAFGPEPLVVAVALPGQDGGPDLSTLRAFLTDRQGFSYRAGIWHIGVAAVGNTVPVAGFMYEDGSPDDTRWADVAPVTLAAG